MALGLWLCVLASASARAQAPEARAAGQNVVAVELHLPGGEDAEGLSGLVAVRKGQALMPSLVRRSVERLWATGRFSDVVARAEEVRGGVRLVFQLTPVSRLARLRFDGNQVLTDGELLDASGLLEGGPLDQEELEGAVSGVLQAYQRKGYDSVRVTATQEPLPLGIQVSLHVTEGQPTLVRQVNFSGSPGLPLPRLLAALAMRPGEVFDRVRLDAGLDQLRTVLREAGHWRAQVGAPAVLVEGSAASVSVPLSAGPRYSVRFHGNHRFTAEVLERVLAYDVAEPLDEVVAGRLARRVESFYRHRGFHDARVRPREVLRPDGEVAVLAFDVDEGQPLRVSEVRFHGNASLGSGTLREVLAERIRAGELQPELDLRLQDDPLDVEGRHGRGPGATEPVPDPATVYVEDAWLEATESMMEQYRERGFLSVVVTLRGLTVDARTRTAAADFDVVEGPQTRVKQVVPDGFPDTKAARATASGMGVHEGLPLSFEAVEAARVALERGLGTQGYLFARVTTKSSLEEGDQVATVVFNADTGPQVKVGKVLVQGLTRTDPDLIMANLNLEEGQPLAMDSLTEGQRRLARLGLFRQVDVTLADPTRREASKDVVVTVHERPRLDGQVSGGYFLVDGPRITLDTAYRNLDGLGLSLLARGKVNYAGWSAEALSADRRIACEQSGGAASAGCDVELQGLSGLGGRGNLALSQPRLYFLLPFEVGARLDLIAERVHRPSYVSSRLAAAAALDWAVASWFNVSLSYEVENNRLRSRAGVLELLNRADQERLRYPFGDFVLHSLRPAITLDFRDDATNPRRGLVLISSAELTRGISVSPTDVAGNAVPAFPINGLKLASSLSGYIPLGRRASLALSARAGTIVPMETGAQPIGSKLFYLGGSSSLRGFREDGVLPEDVREALHQRLRDCRSLISPTGCSGELKAVLAGQVPSSQGGELFTLGKAELRLPALTSLDLGLFFEAGNLWLDRTRLDLERLRYAAGVGLRYMTPVGPLAFDVGFNLDPDEEVNEARTQFHFSIGTF